MDRIKYYKETLQQIEESRKKLPQDLSLEFERFIEKLKPKQPEIRYFDNRAPQQVCPVCGLPVFYKTFDCEIYKDMCFCGTVIDWRNF